MCSTHQPNIKAIAAWAVMLLILIMMIKIYGDVQDMKLISTANNEKLILIAVNNDYMKVFKCNHKYKITLKKFMQPIAIIRKFEMCFVFINILQPITNLNIQLWRKYC